jgi:multisubunit Na+/H+ antiporter MnhG subunit
VKYVTRGLGGLLVAVIVITWAARLVAGTVPALTVVFLLAAILVTLIGRSNRM